MPEELTIDARNTDKIGNLLTGRKHSIKVKGTFEFHIIEMEDINFHFDSAVLLPDYGPDAPQPGTEEQNRVTGLAVIYACYKHAESKEFLQKILVTGHTDKKGSEFYNLSLSQQRAENVFFVLKGNRSKWVDSSLAKNQVEDVQQILKWISFNFQYDCDPGPKTNSMNAETKAAIEKFQIRYNKDFVDLEKHDEKFVRTFEKIDEDGKMGKETWGAFFDMYVLELLIVMGIKEDGLVEIQSKLDFIDKGPGKPAPVVGCGEKFPKSGSTTEEANPVDRRVEVLFFDEAEEPELKCHPAKLVCKKSLCDLFNTENVYKPVPVEVLPLPLPSGVAVRAHLKFVYKTPEGIERAFPKGFPFILKFGDGTTEEQTITKDNGQVFLQVLREKKTFTIEFKFSETNYIAIPENGTDEIVPETNIEEKLKNKFRVFSLPLEWNLKNSDWSLTPAVSNFDNNTKEFKDIDDLSIENIGSEASPVNIGLDPHWQFYKFLYFDRFLKEKLSILPVMIETIINNSGSPEIKSNWVSESEGCQSIPFIKRDIAINNLLLQYKTEPDTFIESKNDGSREYISGITKDTPNAERLRFYDMPVRWKSKNYFARLSGGKDQPAAKEGLFNDLFKEETTDDKPIIFSLDDIVLTDKDLKPISITADDRVAIFSNLFGTDPRNSDVSELGIYKPDNSEPYFSQKVERLKQNKNYIADYPDWTRLVVCKGNLFDVFDKRLTDESGDVIGIRAGVRWVDATNQTPEGIGKPPGEDIGQIFPRPNPIKNNFFIIHPYLQQEYILKTRSLDTGFYNFVTNPDIPSGNRAGINRIGRFDRALLRCCNEDDGTEDAVVLEYFKFSFDFTKAPDSHKNDQTKQDQYKKDTCINICKRWSQSDGTLNPGPAVIESKDSSLKLETKVMWLAQSLPNDLAHFKLDVVPDTGRSFMQGFDGTAELRISANKDEGGGKLVGAHECGHAGTLPDEYIERGTKCSYLQAPLRSNDAVGDFFSPDGRCMMISNKEIRARYYWQVAEWMRSIIGATYIVKHDFWEYKNQLHPFNNNTNKKSLRTFTHWPVTANINTDIGKNKFDVLFYSLGEDDFSQTGSEDFKGNILVMFKMKFEFPETPDHTPNGTFGRISEDLDKKLNRRLNRFFNNKWKVSGKVNGIDFNPCMLTFSFRYLVETITDEDNEKNEKYLKNNGETEGGYENLVEELEDNHDVHLFIEVIDKPTSKTSELDDDELTLVSDDFDKFEKFICEAIGIPVTTTSSGFSINKNDLLPIVNKVLTNTTIDDL